MRDREFDRDYAFRVTRPALLLAPGAALMGMAALRLGRAGFRAPVFSSRTAAPELNDLRRWRMRLAMSIMPPSPPTIDLGSRRAGDFSKVLFAFSRLVSHP